jgi:hypothetical protein
MRRIVLALALAMVAGVSAGCQESETVSVGDTIEGEGVMRQGVGPECPNQWHIATAEGQQLWPIDDPGFQKDGLRVKFRVRKRTDMMSNCQAGTTVEVISLERK